MSNASIVFLTAIPRRDFWLPWLAVYLNGRFLDGRSAYYTPCPILSRSCETVCYNIVAYCVAQFLTQPASIIMSLELKSAAPIWELLACDCIKLNNFTYEVLVVLSNLSLAKSKRVHKSKLFQTVDWRKGILRWKCITFNLLLTFCSAPALFASVMCVGTDMNLSHSETTSLHLP